MAKKINDYKSHVRNEVIVHAVSNGTPTVYIGQEGLITDITRGVYSVCFNDGKTQFFTLNEIEIKC